MHLSQKQKKSLLAELDAMSTPLQKAKPKKKGKPRSRAKSFARGMGPSAVVQAPRRGISNVQGQDSSIPLSSPFAGSEAIGRVNGSAAFALTQYAINPGDPATFPWLSKEALLWNKYEFDELRVEFRPTINEFSANAYGRVIVGVNYDAADAGPSTRSQAENSRPVTAQAPYFGQTLRLRKSDMNDTVRKRYVRPLGVTPGATDIRLYDVGLINFSTDGNINANEVGELWIHYRGTFHEQILESVATAPINYAVSQSIIQTSDPGFALTQNDVARIVSGTTFVANGADIVENGGDYTAPAGNYLVTAICAFRVSGLPTAGDMWKFAAGIGGDGQNFSSVVSSTQDALTNTDSVYGVTTSQAFWRSDGVNSITISAQAVSIATASGAIEVWPNVTFLAV